MPHLDWAAEGDQLRILMLALFREHSMRHIRGFGIVSQKVS
jgi:hypothetical protein